jgi:arsenite methyltransferase
MDTEELKKVLKKTYGTIAQKEGCGCGCGTSSCGPNISEKLGYAGKDLEKVPEGADLGLGCGNPTAFASLREGETVLDLGSGPGLDCFLAADKVGKAGRVIGVDMTPEMIAKARANAQKSNTTNVEFRLGEIEKLPVDDNSVDVIISNCVINLAPDKAKVFREAFRVLKPGGRLMVSDIVLNGELPEWVRESVTAYSACVSGAEKKDRYLEKMRQAGFENITIPRETPFTVDLIASTAEFSCCGSELPDLRDCEGLVSSITVSASKPEK